MSVRRPRLAVTRDAAVAAVAFGLTLAMLAHGSGATRTLDALGVGLAAIACLPLLAHRRRPLGVFVVCTAASTTIESLGYALRDHGIAASDRVVHCIFERDTCVPVTLSS